MGCFWQWFWTSGLYFFSCSSLIEESLWWFRAFILWWLSTQFWHWKQLQSWQNATDRLLFSLQFPHGTASLKISSCPFMFCTRKLFCKLSTVPPGMVICLLQDGQLKVFFPAAWLCRQDLQKEWRQGKHLAWCLPSSKDSLHFEQVVNFLHLFLGWTLGLRPDDMLNLCQSSQSIGVYWLQSWW